LFYTNIKIMEIDIELVNLAAQEIEDVRLAKLFIEDNYLRYLLDFDATELVDPEDKTLGWKEVHTSYMDAIFKKEDISGIEVNSVEKDIYILVIMSVGGTMKIFFDNKEKAEKIKIMVFNWLFNIVPPVGLEPTPSLLKTGS
jgi:hypothetical protein